MSFDITNAAAGRVFWLYGGINAYDAEGEIIEPIRFLRELDSAKGHPVTVRLSSVGGDPVAAASMADALYHHQAGSEVIVDGVAYSAGSILLQGGRSRKARESSMLMVHGPRLEHAGGLEKDLESGRAALAAHRKMIEGVYIRRGISESLVQEWVRSGKDHFFTAQEAVEVDLIDEISNDDVFAASRKYQVAAMTSTSREKQIATMRRAYSFVPSILSTGTVMTQNINSSDAVIGNDAPVSSDSSAAADSSGHDSAVHTAVGDNAVQASASGGSGDVADIVDGHLAAAKASMDSGRAAENKRVSAILGFKRLPAFRAEPVQAVLDACLADIRCDAQTARERAHEALSQLAEAMPVAGKHLDVAYSPLGIARGPATEQGLRMHVSGGTDRVAMGMQTALEIRCGLQTDRAVIDRERRGNEFLSQSLASMMSAELRAMGAGAHGTSTDVVVRYCNTVPAIMAQGAGPSQGGGHLPAVLGNIANKTAMQGWEEAEETWSQWVVPGTLTNYQTHTRTNLALLDKLKLMLPGQNWEYGQMADVSQRITGFFHGLVYSLPIQAIVNDDLNELTRAMAGWGEAAAATIGDVVYLILTQDQGGGAYGQIMDEDSKAIFHADHNNIAGTGGDPSVDTLNTARAAMVSQMDPNSRKVGIRPRYLMHGPNLFSTVRTLLRSQTLTSVAVSGGDTNVESGANAVQDMNLMPVEEHRFTGADANRWHLLAARRTVEVSGVQGQAIPRVDQMPISQTPGISYSLSMPFGAAALDFRGMYRNNGS